MSGSFGLPGGGSDYGQLVQTLQDANTIMSALLLAIQGIQANGVAILPTPAVYAFASLPTTAAQGQFAYCSDARKPSEGVGTGTGVPVFMDISGVWYSYCDGTPAAV